MLVLSRQLNENIELWIPGQRPIEVTVAEIHEKKIGLGVTADRSCAVHRKEIVGFCVNRSATTDPSVRELYLKIISGRYVPSEEDIQRLGLYSPILRERLPRVLR